MVEGSKDFFFGDDSLELFNDWLKENAPKRSSVFILVDSNTHEYCLPRFASELPDLESFEILEMPAGEINKDLEIAGQLLMALSELGADRKSLLISLGGGVVTDMGGFISSIFKRGIESVLVPTSLLAMTDAAIGGKTGVDLGGIKNLVGTFSEAAMTVVWPEFLATLPEEIYSDGLAESYKHALLDNPLFLNKLLNDSSILSNDEIERSIGVKKQIVDSDPHESGTRKTLNLGHTVGHALESFKLTTNDPWSHGRCVAAGILVALELSRSYFSFDSTIRQRVSDFLMYKYQLSSLSSSVFGSLEPWLIHDKKNENGELRFVLLEDVGKPVFNIPVKMDEVQQAWNKVFGNV